MVSASNTRVWYAEKASLVFKKSATPCQTLLFVTGIAVQVFADTANIIMPKITKKYTN